MRIHTSSRRGTSWHTLHCRHGAAGRATVRCPTPTVLLSLSLSLFLRLCVLPSLALCHHLSRWLSLLLFVIVSHFYSPCSGTARVWRTTHWLLPNLSHTHWLSLTLCSGPPSLAAPTGTKSAVIVVPVSLTLCSRPPSLRLFTALLCLASSVTLSLWHRAA